jgi:hypothetical protein
VLPSVAAIWVLRIAMGGKRLEMGLAGQHEALWAPHPAA